MAQALVATTLSRGFLLAGKYRIEVEIGRGGMGTVYLAHHVALDQRVAVKVLAPDATSEVGRFVREARAAAKLQTEHIARVSDVGNAEGIGPYMVMELLEGSDLSQLLAARGPLPVAEVVDAAIEAIDALAEAHALGIVHRDLKPSNLFLAKRADGSETVKVLDFGISKAEALTAEAQKLTETRAVLGSPYYMSPEQLRSARDVDARADVWSLGVVMYELLTGRMPFDGETVGAVFANILEKTPPPPHLFRDVPPALEAAVLRCMRRDPRDRFQHIGELAQAIAPFGSGRAAAALERASAFTTMRGGDARPSAKLAEGAHAPSTASSLAASGSARWTGGTHATRAVPAVAAGALAVATVAILVAIGAVVYVRRAPSAGERASSTATAAVTADAPRDDLPTAVPILADPPATGVPAAPTALAAPAASAPAAPAAPIARPRASARPASSHAPPAASGSEPDLDRRR